MPRQITAFSNPLVKQVRGLRDKKNRRREGLFMAEGLRILTEAREAGHLPRILFFGGAARHELLDALIAATEAAGGEAIETNADILHKLSGKDNPQVVLGVYEAFPTEIGGIDRTSCGPVDRRAGAQGPWQSRHDPQDRRRRRRGRADPPRRLRRPLLG
jgi:TrmH family RNA methyltransferase